MEALIAQCAGIILPDMPLLLAVGVAALLGSVSHCSMMCGPLVAVQMLSLNEQGKSQRTVMWYHLGRAFTYVMLGLLAVTAGSFVFSHTGKAVSSVMLFIAGMVFLVSALMPRKTHGCNAKYRRFDRLLGAHVPPAVAMGLRGILMGFMPCGMLISVLLIVATLGHPLNAVLAMMIFAFATIPVLQLAGFGALSLSRIFPRNMSRIGRVVMAANGVWLCGVGLQLVSAN